VSQTHWKKIVSDPNYIGEADFEEGEEKVVTIGRVAEKESVVTAEGKSEKSVVHFRELGIKPMILNVARAKSIAKVAGSKYIENWSGVQIQLYIEDGIKAFGEIVSAVRVRSHKPRFRADVPKICADCGNQIQASHGMTAEQVARGTAKKYGQALCAECAAKRREAGSAPPTDEALELLPDAEEQADAPEAGDINDSE